MRASLHVIEGPHQGEAVEFADHETALVGRAPEAHLCLTADPGVSRYHFLLGLNPPSCYLRDLGSNNGTFVNGKRVGECTLRDGDVICGGRTRIRFSLLTEVEDAITEAGFPAGPGSTTKEEPSEAVLASMETGISAGKRPAPAIPGYQMLHKLGQGGMGAVYLARHEASGQNYAVKVVVPEGLTRKRSMQFFLREMNILSRLEHHRIVRFRDGGIAGGQFYFVMEYVPTVSARELLSSQGEAGRAPLACTIICQALEGLHYAHGLGFVHRDIKPTNLLVYVEDGKPQAKLSDFGLAKNFKQAGLSGMTLEGQARGTLGFMAPEQLINSRDAKPSGDIYSVGATLYYLLTNMTPHDFRKNKDSILVVLEDEPVSLTRRWAKAPQGLADLVHRAMARNPRDRFPSAEALRQALLPYAQL